ncbi:hypothetical protein [Caenimonas soli]|uniref:hypothetical protein n=1 Tax=Caenimonas soli TaxID=2735555 RepID=UPI00155434F0|nr:hypothetical protein [Caenimonas soli]NPC57016.1 hypothetical protein [Caenimonas soli]
MRTLRTRRELALLNAQARSDFKAHWPMRVYDLFMDLAGGTLLGLALGLAALLSVLVRAAV